MVQWKKIDVPIALYGLAANPPHRGHWSCVQDLVQKGYKVLMVPSFSHAFGKEMVEYETRLRWLRQAGSDFGVSEACYVWAGESSLAERKAEGEPIFSIDVLDLAKSTFGGKVVLAVGPDNADASVFTRFHESKRIIEHYGLVVTPEVEGVRSTIIREQIAGGNLRLAELAAWVGPSIAAEVFREFRAANAGLPSILGTAHNQS